MAAEDHNLEALLLDAIAEVLRQAADPDRVLELILHEAVKRTGASRGAFVEAGTGGAFTYKVRHRFETRHSGGVAGEYSRSLFAHVTRTGEPIMVSNVLEDMRFKNRESIQNLRIVSILCQPIRVDGKVCGIVYLESTTPGHFTEAHSDLLQGLSEVAGTALTALRAGRQILAERDHLRLTETSARREAEESRGRLSREWQFGRFVGRTPAVRALEKEVTRAAASDFPVLLTGETGTGKSLLAAIIHYTGRRRGAKLVQLSCPTLERGMVESTLFGHRRGAFTGAEADRIGKVQDAEGGSLYLDEISTLPVDIQPKLLRLLEERTYEPVGDHREQRADVRFLASTNQDLDRLTGEGRFRLDLYQRLNFLAIRLPPLRERRGDIPLLLRHFLDQGRASAVSARWLEITPEAAGYLERLDFDWPGNVRQVQQLAARLAVREGLERVDEPIMREVMAGIQSESRQAASSSATAGAPVAVTMEAATEQAEREALQRVLREMSHLSRAQQAEHLGISESKYYKLLRKHLLT